MADPYRRYGSAAPAATPFPMDRGTAAKPSFPGYVPTDAPGLTNHNAYGTKNFPGASSDFLQKDARVPTFPGVDDFTGLRPEPGASGMISGSGIKGYTPYEDPSLLARPRNVASGSSPGIPDVNYERPDSMKRVDGHPVAGGESNVLFVDGLPTDCTRREIGHLFRPFIGFRELRVVHKEPRRRGDKAAVLCFVEFSDVKCARTAMEALQGYKFDDKKLDSGLLRIHFAHFPFRPPSDLNEQRF